MSIHAFPCVDEHFQKYFLLLKSSFNLAFFLALLSAKWLRVWGGYVPELHAWPFPQLCDVIASAECFCRELACEILWVEDTNTRVFGTLHSSAQPCFVSFFPLTQHSHAVLTGAIALRMLSRETKTLGGAISRHDTVRIEINTTGSNTAFHPRPPRPVLHLHGGWVLRKSALARRHPRGVR